MGLNEDLHFVLAPDGRMRRGLRFCALLPRVKSAVYGEPLIYSALSRWDAPTLGKDLPEEGDVLFTMNNELERGHRIETVMPDLGTAFFPTFAIPDQAHAVAETLLPSGAVYVGIYPSAVETNQRWQGWSAWEWTEFVIAMRYHFPAVIPVLLGSWWDNDMGVIIKRIWRKVEDIPHIDLIGKTADCQIMAAVLLRLKINIGLASGIGITAASMGRPTVMLYPPELSLLSGAWPAWEMIMSGLYQGHRFSRPREVMKKILPLLHRVVETDTQEYVRPDDR